MQQDFTVVNANGAIQFSGTSQRADLLSAYGTVVLQRPPSESVYWTGTAWAPLMDLDDDNTLTGTPWVAGPGGNELSYGPNLPNPTTVSVTCDNPLFIPDNSGEAVEVTDGELNLTCYVPGNYTITLTADQYEPKVIQVEATY